MTRLLAFATLAVLAIPPVVAARILLRELRGEATGSLRTAVACSGATSLIWSFIAGAVWIAGGSPYWLALPAAFCLGVGGACALRQTGWTRWVELFGVAGFGLAPALLIAIAAPGLASAARRGRAHEALRRAVPSLEEPAVALALDADELLVREGAAGYFYRGRAVLPGSIPHLVGCLGDAEKGIRGQCAAVLRRAGPPGLAGMADYLRRASPEGADAVAEALRYGARLERAEADLFRPLAQDPSLTAEARAAAGLAVALSKP